MKILVLNWRDPFHPLAGGAEISLLEHIKYWQKKGARVTWYASAFPKSKEEEVVYGIKIVRKGSHYTVALHFFLDWVMGKFKDINVIVDCFHFISFLTPLYVRKKQIVAFIHEVASEVWFKNIFFPLNFIGYFAEPYIIRLYMKRVFITVSKSTEKELCLIGIPKKNIHIIPNGVTINRIKNIKKENNPTIIFLGRLSKDKGIEDALKVFELLSEQVDGIKLWVVGKYESRKYLQQLESYVDKLKHKKNCLFMGFVDEKKKSELLAKAWILIHPSKKEGWGLNVIEANTVGTPAVGYDVPGLRDSIMSGKTGVLVQPTIESLTKEVGEIIKDEKKRNQIRKNAIQWASNFNWDLAGQKSWSLVSKL